MMVKFSNLVPSNFKEFSLSSRALQMGSVSSRTRLFSLHTCAVNRSLSFLIDGWLVELISLCGARNQLQPPTRFSKSSNDDEMIDDA